MNSNDAYRQLGEGIPTDRSAGPAAIPTDAKRLRLWIDALPRANPTQTQRQLGDALDGLTGVRLSRGVRLAVLEALRPVVLETSATLVRQLQDLTLPLPPGKARAMEQLIDFDRRMAEGYRLALIELCAPTGRIPFLAGRRVASAIERSLHHRVRSMQHAFSVYQSPPAGSWRQLHRLYAFAAAHRLDGRPVAEADGDRAVPLRQRYAQALLVALSNPYRFSQKEQQALWSVARDLAGLLTLDGNGAGEADDRFAIPLDRDEGPGYVAEERADDADGAYLWLDLSALRRTVDAALVETPAGAVRIKAGPRAIETSAELLRRIRAGWGRAAARTHQRLSGGHQLETVFGLTALHFHLSGRQDFDSFLRRTGAPATAGERERHDWAHAVIDAARVPVLSADVLDQSLGGYRVRWPAGQQKARVGELVGLSIADAVDGRRWMLGAIRWLRYEHDGSVDAGIELLARRAHAVAVRSLDAAGRPRMRAIQFEPVRGSGDPQCLQLAAPSAFDMPGGAIEVVRAMGDDMEADDTMNAQCRDVRISEAAADFVLLTTERSGVDA